ncbi:response regulator [Pseudonocardia petroleophila]|uniref:response regulator transcription factor n=1 Tax=Pseudonocardia petroleophila TaxID=37331 RepID=UPI002108000A|nr:response regulator transcription factor [Pseudonocardia petroleophila]
MRARVLVVDDHPVFRRGMTALLRASGFDVVAEAASGTEAVAAAARELPDVVLMDLGLPDLGGAAATERITAAHPDVRVVVVTSYDDEASVRAALDAGADGYVTKDASPDQIVAAVEAARMGALWLGSGVPRPGATAPAPAPALPGLSPREAAVAELVGKGLSNPVIATRLGLSPKTVANYVSTVLLRLGAADRAEAIRLIRDRRSG